MIVKGGDEYLAYFPVTIPLQRIKADHIAPQNKNDRLRHPIFCPAEIDCVPSPIR